MVNKKVIVYGISILSEMLFYDALGREDFIIEAFTVDKEYLNGNEFLGLPLVDFQDVDKIYPPSDYDMISVTGRYRNMKKNEKMYRKAKEKEYFLRNYISEKADCFSNVSMGENNIVFPHAHVGIGGQMGNNNMIRQNVYLGHEFKMGDNNKILAGSNVGGLCNIKNRCVIGLGATVIEELTIEDETLIGAGSVVIRNTEPYSRNVGNPSRIIGYNNEVKCIGKGENNG